jgi:hypothetical protein
MPVLRTTMDATSAQNIHKRLCRSGYTKYADLAKMKNKHGYKHVNYSKFFEYIQVEFNISKSTFYNLKRACKLRIEFGFDEDQFAVETVLSIGRIKNTDVQNQVLEVIRSELKQDGNVTAEFISDWIDWAYSSIKADDTSPSIKREKPDEITKADSSAWNNIKRSIKHLKKDTLANRFKTLILKSMDDDEAKQLATSILDQIDSNQGKVAKFKMKKAS